MENKQLDITFHEWDYTCGDGCCYDYGTDIIINGVQIDTSHDDPEHVIVTVLEHLGYDLRITRTNDFQSRTDESETDI